MEKCANEETSAEKIMSKSQMQNARNGHVLRFCFENYDNNWGFILAQSFMRHNILLSNTSAKFSIPSERIGVTYY